MSIAQRLYEGVDLPGEGTVGLITYMRTDSLSIAESALREIGGLVQAEFGPKYALAEPRRFKTRSRNAQEAHEAIRPTSVFRTPERVAASLERDQLRLYTLIWQRTVATQMAQARFNQVGVDVEAVESAAGTTSERPAARLISTDTCASTSRAGTTQPARKQRAVSRSSAEQVLRMLEVLPEQHFTQPSPRFS